MIGVAQAWWDDAVNHHPLDLLTDRALVRLPPPIAAYVAGAAGDGVTDRRNIEDFRRHALPPAVGVDVSVIDTTTRLPGVDLAHPVVLAPTALYEIYHPEGEAATARAATDTASLLVLSSDASQMLESSAAHLPGGFYAQLALWQDRGVVREYVRRAEEAGARTLVLTLDCAVGGQRYRQQRFMQDLPAGIARANMAASGDAADGDAADGDDIYRRMAPGYIDPSVTWSTSEESLGSTTLPVIGKGIMRARDAGAAVRSGLAAVAVSNHGGRSLDNGVSTLEVLPEVVDAVGGEVPVLLDGGVRRGSDVLTALALGARAVMVGRPYVWGLAADGSAGVRTVVETLVRKLRVSMALCGVTSVQDVPGDLVRERPAR